MRGLIVVLSLLACLVVADAKPARKPFEDAPRGLWLNLDRGQSYYAEISTNVKMHITVMGQKVDQTQDQVFVWHVRPQGLSPKGEAVVEFQVADVRVNMDMAGNKVEFDSVKKQGDNGLTAIFGAMLNHQFKVTVKRDGTIEKIDGVDELKKKLTAQNVPLRESYEQMMSEGAIRMMLSPLTHVMPDHPVSAGVEWSRRWTAPDTPLVNVTNETKFTYVSNTGPRHQIRTSSNVTMDKAKNGAGGQPIGIKTINVKTISGAGMLTFDSEKGRLAEAEQKIHITGKMGVDVGGMEIEIELDQTQTSAIRTSQVNPMRAK